MSSAARFGAGRRLRGKVWNTAQTLCATGAIASGETETDGLTALKELLDALMAQTPLGHLGQPADVADVVAFLAGQDVRWVAGLSIRATGGIV